MLNLGMFCCVVVWQLHDNDYDVGRALQELVKVINPKSADRRWSDDDAVRIVLTASYVA